MFQNINPLAKSTAMWEILLMLLGAFILGYLFCKWKCWGNCCDCASCDCNGKTKGNVSAKGNAHVSANLKADAKTDTKAKVNYAWSGNANASQKDDLKKVEGIGPAIEKVLNASGIVTFAKLADTNVSMIREILDKAGSHFQIHDGETWAEQSALLRDGKMTEFDKLVEELKHGHRVNA
jgi:predicted flap endonuclease-1-like 5' DNA nuclease